MHIYKEKGKQIIQCECGFRIYESPVLRVRVALIKGEYLCPKCPKCKRFSESFNIKLLEEVPDGCMETAH